MKRGKKINKYKKKMRYLKGTLLLSLLLLLLAGGSVLAKYYSLQVKKGVAVAADLYFESDKLSKVTYNNGDVSFQSFVPYVGNGKWNADGVSEAILDIDIMNYKSKLQYNEGIDITYDVYVKMAEIEERAIDYRIQYGNTTKTILKSTDEVQKMFEGIVLPGADEQEKTKSNVFTLLYTPNGEKGEPKPLYLWVVPTDPSYLAESRESFTLGGEMKVSVFNEPFSITGQMDVLLECSEENESFTEEERARIASQSALVYTITTMGEYSGAVDETHKNQVPILLSYNTNYLELDRFSQFYDSEVVTETGERIRTIRLWVDSYSQSEIVFYKTNQEGYQLLNDNTDSYQEFSQLITCE